MKTAFMAAIPVAGPGTQRRRALGLAMAALCLVTTASGAGESSPGVTHALLINGGARPSTNYQSHLHHLEDMVELLERRGLQRERIHIFSADGEEREPDLAVRDALPKQFWLIAGTRMGKRLRPRTEVTDTLWQGRSLRPARKKVLRHWFETAGRELSRQDQLLLFVTDHGTENRADPDNGAISLWREQLTVEDLKELLALLPRGVRTVMVMSQCFSGTFANVMFNGGSTEPSGGVCGFFSTLRDQPAYGCYPEGRDRDRLGHAFRFIDALDRHATTGGAHREVLVTDRTPDVPLRTSDAYLERLVAEEAGVRGDTVEELVDRLLREAWRERPAWEGEIRLLDKLGDTFGTFSPRTLAELEAYEGEMPALIERARTYAGRWRATLTNVKSENLTGLLVENPEWKERLEDEAISALDAEGRKGLLVDLLSHLERHARGRPEIWDRLDDLRQRARRAARARWRLEVRRGALRRMRSQLIGIAGRVLLTRDEPAADEMGRRDHQRLALERLDLCETFEPGELRASETAARRPAVRRFPPLADEIEGLERMLPSWLGVRYRPVPAALRADRELPEGATWLEAIFPRSPAEKEGLEAGDLILGTPGRPFSAIGHLRELVMTSPRGVPLQLDILRPGEQAGEDQEFRATLSLLPLPLKWPELPGPPQVGELAPPLPGDLEPVGLRRLRDLDGRPHLLFFWATWCLPCKKAVPEVLALADARRLRVLAITDEDPAVVAGFLEEREKAFFRQVAADPRRRSFISYGVSGTPTIILVDEEGVVRHRQVGYNTEKGVTVEGWSWSGS